MIYCQCFNNIMLLSHLQNHDEMLKIFNSQPQIFKIFGFLHFKFEILNIKQLIAAIHANKIAFTLVMWRVLDNIMYVTFSGKLPLLKLLLSFGTSEQTCWSFATSLYLLLSSALTCEFQHFTFFIIRKESMMLLLWIAQDCMWFKILLFKML